MKSISLHFQESCFWTLSIVKCFFPLKTTFRKLALLPSSGKKGWGEGWHLLCGGPLGRASLNHRTLMGSDDGVMNFEESCFWTLSIVQWFFLLKTTFRKLALFPSSGKKGEGKGWHVLCRAPSKELVSITGPDGSRASFWNVVFKGKKHWTMDKV
jgi:hypothetical protein